VKWVADKSGQLKPGWLKTGWRIPRSVPALLGSFLISNKSKAASTPADRFLADRTLANRFLAARFTS
jgi:hypothetical protein